jgi:diguanylate cyclase (GGDEF)-like protein/PAS domain S-box-containing protein
MSSRAVLGEIRLDRRLGWIIALYLVLIAGIVGYNAVAVARQRGAAVIVNVAARQRALAERYVKDELLVAEGLPAQPEEDAAQLRTNADALLHGGSVIAVQGADEDVHIHIASGDPRVIAKLDAERLLIERLIASGSRLQNMRPDYPGYEAQTLELRVIGAELSSISNDAVGQMTRNTEAAFLRLETLGIALGILGALVAISMGLLLRRAGAQRSAQFRSLVHEASDVITLVDPAGRIRYQTPSAGRLVGVPPDELLGMSYMDLVDANDRDHVHAVLADVAESHGKVATAEYRLRHTDGSSRYVESIVSNLIADPTVHGLVLNTRDVTDRKRLEDELAHQAFHDSLTGLSNRALFRDRLDHALARAARHDQGVAVILLDLDGFKTVNDGLGHDVGDQLLVSVGGRIHDSARTSDTVARLGGDEFAILLEDDPDEARATATAGRLLASLVAPFSVGTREVFIGASIGIAVSGEGSADTDALIRNADTAMYAAKANGKGRYEMFQPAMYRRAVEHFEVQADLQHALGRGELRLHYQPIVDFSSGVIQGAEALIRWEHPTRGLLPPIEFIGIAEETGLIVPIGRWVLEEACRQVAAWRAQHAASSDMWVSVNLSTRQLFEPDLVSQVRDVLSASGLEPSALMLEITEGSLMQGVAETTAKLQGLKELGVRLAIDDFGTGSSSLGYLRQFPIDVLKIDKSFVDEITTKGSEGLALVRAIIDLADTLQLATVAEGIELVEQAAELRSAGCGSGQGFLFARPVVPEAMESLLRRGGRTRAPDQGATENGARASIR